MDTVSEQAHMLAMLETLRRRLVAVDVMTPEDHELFAAVTTAVETKPSVIVSDAFETAVNNIVRSTKRSLLDFIDLWAESAPPELSRLILQVAGRLKRRVHNDVSLVQDQVLAAHRICMSGGLIPPFGRSEAELAPPAAVSAG